MSGYAMVEMWENVQRACGTSTNRAVSGVELCADELVVGGGVGRSYDRRRRRAAHFSSAAAAWRYGRRRRRQTG